MKTYEDLVAEALGAPVNGPDLTYLEGRYEAGDTPWSYRDRANELVADAAEGTVFARTAGASERADAKAEALPFVDDQFGTVLYWHDRYHAPEVHRVLRPGGVFLTEQIGGLDGLVINEALGAPLPDPDWALSTARADLESAGFQVAHARTAFPERLFHDVGALIYYLRAVPRQVPGFSVEAYDKPLLALHDQMSAGEPFRDRAVRFLIEATPA